MEDNQDIFDLIESYSSQPVYILSGSGSKWYYSDLKKCMVRVTTGSECIFCEEDPTNARLYIVQIGTEIFSVPKKDLIEVGWN